MRRVIEVLLFVVAVYVLLVAYLFLFQSRFLYFPGMPGREIESTPRELGLDYQDLQITASDGVLLHGWFVPANPEARGALLFFHGNAGNISHRLDSIQVFHRLGLSVLIIDYRGYGSSDGKPSEAGTYLDAQAAWEYLTVQRSVPPERIVLFGRSLGGPIAAWLAAEQNPAALIVESAFTSVPDIAQEKYPFLPARLLTRFDYPTRSYIEKVDSPILVIHSRDDEIIPFHHGEELFQSAGEPRELLEIQGGHNTGLLVSGPAYSEGLRKFIGAVLPAP